MSPRPETVRAALTRLGFTLTGMGGNLSAYCRPSIRPGYEDRVVLRNADASLAPTRRRDPVEVIEVNLAEETAGDIKSGTYTTYARYNVTAGDLIAHLDLPQIAGRL